MGKFEHVSVAESAVMQRMHSEGMGLRKIKAVTGRSFDTISKHVFKKHYMKKTKAKGRPRVITTTVFRRLVAAHEQLLKQRPRAEVTIKQVKAKVGLTCCDRVVSNAFHKNGLYFRPHYEKPEITDDDIKLRRAFASDHGDRTATQWGSYLHAVIDNKVFPVYINGKMRDYAARRPLRGVYRTRSRVYTKGNTKPNGALKKNTGAKSVMVTCAIGAGRTLLWHVVPGGKWNSEAAASAQAGGCADGRASSRACNC